MATLRDPLFGLNNAPSAEWQAAAAEAARPNSLRGGWESGRIANERNALAIDEFAARAAGDEQRANTLRMQNEALGQAQARVAPEVGRVEDINGVGDALNWAAGQVGQGAASMVEPLAATTALGAVGRVVGMLPGTAGKVGRAIGTVGGPLAAYGINQRQMAGEFANTAMADPELSDPHYSMFFHLKQFSYSFHQTILKRAVKEMNHGNLAPLGAFVWYIPTMIATDVVKGLVQGGGELPAYMKGYDLGDWVMHGVQRAGVLGAGQIGVDAAEDVFSLAGPGVEQAIDALRAPLSETTIKALPAHGLYAQALK